MTTILASPSVSSTFTPEPGLPWLRQDPTMQCPAAFVGVQTMQTQAYEPMARHFPAGTTLAMRRVTSPDELTEGVYWLERTYHQTNGVAPYTRCAFGRYAGLTPTTDERSRMRRHKQGRVHFELAADVLVTDLRQRYHLREDGTETCYVDFTDSNFRLWRISHYVSLANPSLASLPTGQAGVSSQQQRWLDEEALIGQGKGEEYRVHVLGTLPDDDLRVVLSGEQLSIFYYLVEGPKLLTYSQAKKCKASAVAITSRTAYTGRMLVSTDYYKQQQVAVLLDWFASLARLHRAEAAARALSEQNKAAYQQYLASIHQTAVRALGEFPEDVAAEELALAA